MSRGIVADLKAHRDIDNNRCMECGHWTDHDDDCIIGGAVAEIERLRAENKRLDSLLIRQNAVMSSDDIVPRLRECATYDELISDDLAICCEAAAEIERLRQLVDDFTDPGDCWFESFPGYRDWCEAHQWQTTDDGRTCPHARAKQARR